VAGDLRWRLTGTLEWHRVGLSPPVRVHEATDAYFADQDTTGASLGCGFRTTSNRRGVTGAAAPSA
jgi:hypothetical protein